MNMFQEALLLLKRPKGEKSTSLQFRLFAFFALYVFVLALCFTLLLMLFDVFSIGENGGRIWMESEISHLSDEITADYGRLSRQGTAFAEQLSGEMELWLNDRGLKASELQSRPELIEEMLSSKLGVLLTLLQTNKCSGAFVILDATVNPALENAADSRAGIFLKRTEPNAIDLLSSKVHYLRGPASVARASGLELLGQWQMEFDVSQADYFHKTMRIARENTALPLSRLYYWSPRIQLRGNSETGMLLSLPLRGRDGTVFGICGLEMSSMLFKLEYSPDNRDYPRVFSTLSPMRENGVDTDAGLLAGNSYLTNSETGGFSVVPGEPEGIKSFKARDGALYYGMLSPIKLYPQDSPHGDTGWTLALMMPEGDWNEAVKGNNAGIFIAFAALIGLSLLLAAFISRRYLKPVVGAIEMISGGGEIQRTNIAEIDDLLEYLSARDAEYEAVSAELARAKNSDAQAAGHLGAPDLSAYGAFVRNIETLSAAERAVFKLYMQGYTAKEIAQTLCLSINTIKTHNRRIYTKLNVTSRKELMVYVQMMAEDTREEEQ